MNTENLELDVNESITETISVKEEKKELTEEEKKKIQEFYNVLVERRLRPRIQEVIKYMRDTNKTLDEIYHDLSLKKCGLSVLNRSFLVSFDRSDVENLIKNYLIKK